MTPKAKAEELVSYFAIKCAGDKETGVNNLLACQCAIICVDEVIAELEKINGYNATSATDEGQDCAPSQRADYFRLVKKELNRL